METRCNQCGKILQPDARQCGNCGAPATQPLRQCPECDEFIPVKSVFCPCCHHLVWNDMQEPEPAAERTGTFSITITDEPLIFPPAKEPWKVKAAPAPTKAAPAAPTAPAASAPPAAPTAPAPPAKSRRKLLWIIPLLLLAAGIWLYDWGGGFDHTSNPHQTLTGSDTVPRPEPRRMNVVQATSIYNSAMLHDNRIGDRSAFGPAAYALVADTPTIMGLNYFSGERQRSFFKITTLRKRGGAWRCCEEVTRYESGGTIVADRDLLRLAGENIPRFEQIAGRTYFFFIYLVQPETRLFGTSESSHLKLTLYDIDAAQFITLDYECEQVMINGTRLLHGKVASATPPADSPQHAFLKKQLERLPIIYRPTKAEQQANSPRNATQKWLTDNKQAVEALRKGQLTATFETTLYSSPLFSRNEVDMTTKVSTETYVYYVTHSNAVMGYNLYTRKYFIAFVSQHHTKPAIEINSNGTLHIVTADLDIDFDPAKNQALGNPL